MRMNDVPGYQTSDLGLAAALKTVGFKLLSLEPTDGRRVTFVFKNEEDISNVAHRFWDSQLALDALSYFGTIKLLKSQLHSLKR